ncbi:hypothetical protein ANRL4_04433 [Anaerolineae bacterium]|nr:hypothetical protein ANRL4_04433 [Anaerolineae bacterium]
MRFLRKHILTKENMIAMIICILLLALIVFASNAVSNFIYAGF